MKPNSLIIAWIFPFMLGPLFFVACSTETKSLIVSATAYNSLPSQTHKKHPTVTAWGDSLKPGMKCIAVSRDLIPLGLNYNTEVKIEGLPGTYLVLDKMSKRHHKTIDIYMGIDKKTAMLWGRKKVKITWGINQMMNDK